MLSERQRIRHREYMRAYYYSSPERQAKIKARVKRYREANPEKVRAMKRAYTPVQNARRRAKAKADPTLYYRQHLARWGVTPEQYERQLAAQGGGCWFCGSDIPMNRPSAPVRRLLIDHDHATGARRGLLCSPCNLSLGMHERGRTSHRIPIERITTYLATDWAVGF